MKTCKECKWWWPNWQTGRRKPRSPKRWEEENECENKDTGVLLDLDEWGGGAILYPPTYGCIHHEPVTEGT